jgi:DNA-binding response OmpR family regulator
VITAVDGVEALEKLRQNYVSMIVSDWMMPRMNGMELCKAVRADANTSHIPFIMLTAKTDNDSKVQGMDQGADAYIEKPFSMQYLEACIKNLIDMRRLLREKFSHQPLEPLSHIASNPVDNDFLVKMNKIIEDNFSNPDLSVWRFLPTVCA